MKPACHRLLPALLFCLLAWTVSVPGQGLPLGIGPKVVSVDLRFVGPKEVNEQLIRANISVRVGDTHSHTAVDQDVRNLYAMGLFLNVRVSQELQGGGVALTYILQARPKLTEISFSGNEKYSNKKLTKLLKSKVGEPLDEQLVFNDSQEIKKKYASAGYPDTQVKYVLSVDEPAGRATVRFEVTENTKQRIIDVVFDDATAFPQKKLRKVVKTRRWWFMSWLTGSGKLKQDELDEDRERLREYYWDRGYIDFEVKDIQFMFPETNRMVVDWKVFEGSPYKVGDITLKGAALFPTNSTDQLMPMKPGDTFTPKGMEKDTALIEDWYGARGYIDVTANSRNLEVGMIPNTVDNTIDLEYTVTEGQKSFIERIEIRGNWKTKDRVLRRELSVYPGDTFDMVKVKLSQRRLEGLGYFEKVEAKPEATDIPNRKNLVISVEEKSTGNVTFGVGFSSVDSLVGFVELTQGNFDLFNPPHFQGGGQKARMRLAIGTERKDVMLGFTEPWFLGRKLRLDTEFYYSQLDYLSVNDLYNQNELGGRIGLSKPLFHDFLIGSVYYSVQSVDIVDVSVFAPPAITEWAGKTLLSTVGAGIAWDNRNSSFLPNKGGRIELNASVTGGPLGGDASYYNLDLRGSRYFPGLAKGHIIEILGRVGFGDTLSDTPDIPFFKRYYLGGLYSLRGYEYRDVGPKQLTGDNEWEPVGGDTYWFASVEYSIPVIERVRLAAFYDVGMVYPGAFSFQPGAPPRPQDTAGYNTGTYASDFGFGIRLNLPIGPLRLDYAIPLKHDSTLGGSGRFQFGVGYTREL
jgi:outer membrane protein insertion porin family